MKKQICLYLSLDEIEAVQEACEQSAEYNYENRRDSSDPEERRRYGRLERNQSKVSSRFFEILQAHGRRRNFPIETK
jgi:hypothetical protein